MSTLSVFLAFVLVSTVQGYILTRDCPKGWVLYRWNCYLFSEEKVNFKQAMIKCAEATGDGRLVQVHDEEEEEWLQLQFMLRGMERVWMGVSDIIKENKFLKLSNAENIQFNNWGSGEPNNSGKEHCVEWKDGKWNDLSCESKNGFACERPLFM
ncbi:C-type lectin domain family 4 member M-like [Saccostrea cucullata]|uniref:C-type lectin domain family 4 member M-like n=1 Tax=Saccostrea cuccullata TaxID=36930 RepID=UPI002ED1D955